MREQGGVARLLGFEGEVQFAGFVDLTAGLVEGFGCWVRGGEGEVEALFFPEN